MTVLRHTSIARRLGMAAIVSSLALGAIVPAAGGARAAGTGPTAANTLSIGWGFEARTLDPAGYDNNPEIWTVVNLYDQLLRIGPDGKTILPGLATSWTTNKTGTVYTFHLRPNVYFHDGSQLTASDVKFAIDRARGPKELWGWTLGAITSVAAPNPSTVVVSLKHQWAPLLSDLALFNTGIYPAAYFKKVGASGLGAHPIGTGPYMLDTWKHGQFIRFKKNDKYFDAAKYPMQYVQYNYVPNDNTRLLQVETGALDVDNVLPYNLISQVENNPSASVQINPSTQVNYFTFNTSIKPLDDVKVRLALTHAIDRAAIVKAVLYGHGTPANSFMPAGAIAYNPNIPVPAYDMKLAKKYLSESTVPNGFSMTMEVASGNSVYNAEAQIFQSEVAPLGIKVNIVQVDPTALSQLRNSGKYHAEPSLWTNDIPDPDELVSFAVDYSSGSNAFYSWYNNPTLGKLSQQAEQTSDVATRQKLYYQIQQIWANDQPFLALYYSPFVNAVNKKVHGFSENPLGYFNLMGVTKS